MAYMVHITRDLDGLESMQEIALEDWMSAVNSVDGVRLAEGDYSVRLPETGQVFVLRNNGGDAELHVPHTGEWRRVFRWEEGNIKFVGTEEFINDPMCRVRTVARTLAAALGAVMCGEDGRIHD
jgi:hypothetical protein